MKKIVVNGTFDLLHIGHIKLLEFAKSIEDAYLYVLIDGDERVKKLKGNDRPIYTQYERKTFLEAIRYVDQVDIFNTDEELISKIQTYSPDIMVKGSDYINKPIIGEQYCKKIIFYDRITEYSTTQKIQDIIDRR
jgi:D-beta-D-heptose 7-phosphate kinase/D-beta-D-heptose 1-phosphate adenosyltransferase